MCAKVNSLWDISTFIYVASEDVCAMPKSIYVQFYMPICPDPFMIYPFPYVVACLNPLWCV